MPSSTIVKKVAKKSAVPKRVAKVKTTPKKSVASKKAAPKRRVKKLIKITVVDKHHHVMKPIWDAVRSRAIPGQGVKLLHFDSHPDMGVIGCEAAANSKERQRVKDIIPKIFANRFNEKECLELSDIATWIPTFAAQGLVDEVIWCAGWWCRQFPQGSWDLLVGKCKKTQMMKIAVPGDRTLEALSYWAGDDDIAKCEDLEMTMPWKLHVVKFTKAGTFTKEGLAKITSICKNSPWILDIDEDYLSCQNPFTVAFSSMYGEDCMDRLKTIYMAADHGESQKYNDLLEKIATKDTFLLPPGSYRSHEFVAGAERELTRAGVSRARAERLLEDWRALCREILPAKKDEDDYLEVRDVNDSGIVTDTAGVIQVPHHISTLPEMLAMLKSTRDLFENHIKRAPGVITVATSRYDEYTPEVQAGTINELLLDTLTETWSETRRTRVLRRDYRSPLSIDDRYDTVSPNVLALFLSNGKKYRLRPASK